MTTKKMNKELANQIIKSSLVRIVRIPFDLNKQAERISKKAKAVSK